MWALPFRSQILWFISAHQGVGEKEKKKKEKNYLQSFICLCSRKEGDSREIFTNFFSWWVWTLWLQRLAHLAESMWMKRKQPLNSSLRFFLHLAGSAIFRVLFLCTIFFSFFLNMFKKDIVLFNHLFIYICCQLYSLCSWTCSLLFWVLTGAFQIV